MVIKWPLIVIKRKKNDARSAIDNYDIRQLADKCHNGTCLHNRFILFQYQLNKYNPDF